MKKTLWSICIGLAVLAAAASAATVELMPDIESIARQGYNSSGRLAGNGITAADVKSWLGSSSRADGWYTTTGNGDMNWGQASVNTGNQSITLPNMNGTAGVCAGLKMTIENIQTYEGLTFSFTLTPPGTGPTFTYSLWYETTDGDIVELCKGSRGNNGSVWNVSYDLTGEQMADMKANGNGKVYAVLGSAGGNNGNNAVLTDISLEGTLAVPEPATASLGLLGLAALMLRRRRAA
ncbi:PEP-CTERM sorting domain-containing protein [uncultured Akkermansia sp.]|uniref:PEP-CTERM sorting domain-containing protein n=1 Tax=uncultured Akkermansia sp. TaxID=512294 RepID=UPI00265CBA90|nr:PEP-CTERM sorting domain-containing protein [uncultured Akkermansia sp.]